MAEHTPPLARQFGLRQDVLPVAQLQSGEHPHVQANTYNPDVFMPEKPSPC
jgi:hypothetical protein